MTNTNEIKVSDYGMRNKSKVIHVAVERAGIFGGTLYTTLCGRLHKGYDDNRTIKQEEASCKFCLKILSKMTNKNDSKFPNCGNKLSCEKVAEQGEQKAISFSIGELMFNPIQLDEVRKVIRVSQTPLIATIKEKDAEIERLKNALFDDVAGGDFSNGMLREKIAELEEKIERLNTPKVIPIVDAFEMWKKSEIYMQQEKIEQLEKENKELKEKWLNRMICIEEASKRNPNLMQTYAVMWKALKKEIEFSLRKSDESKREVRK